MAKKSKAGMKLASDLEVLASQPMPAAVKSRAFQSFQRFTTKRSSLLFHEQNPRSIDQHAFRKLRDFIKREGLLTSLIVNKRTVANGFDPSQDGQLVIVGGHQRCRAMDEIVGYPTRENSDYDVPIDLIEVDPSRERQFLVALNNAGMQGSWDLDILADLLATPGVDPLATGFDRAELAAILDEGVVEQILGGQAAEQIRTEAPILESLEEIAMAGREADQANRAAQSTPAGLRIPASAAAQADQSAAIQGMKDRRREWKDSVNSTDNQANFYFILVAQADQDVYQLLTRLGLPPDQQTYDLRDFLTRVGFEFDFGDGSELGAQPVDENEPAGA